MFGLTFEKLLIIGVIAAFLIGPERLPHYAAVLGRFARQVRDFANGAKERVKDEMGDEYESTDWKKLDPRQYDPRRIIREALADEGPEAVKPVNASAMTSGGAAVAVAAGDGPRPESAFAQRQRKLRDAAEAASAAGRNASTPWDDEST